MSLRIVARRLTRSLVVSSFLLAASCNDDPAPHVQADLWHEATLVDAPAQGALFSVAFSGARGLAAGVGVDGLSSAPVNTPYLAARMSDDTWARPSGVPLPARSLFSAVGFALSGEALVAGVSSDALAGFILDERGGWSRHDFAFGGMVFAAGAGIVRAAGYAPDNNVVLKSNAPDLWAPESLPFPGRPGEHGITDMSARDGVFVACGFDDGGDGSAEFPNSVLFQSSGGGWVRLDVPCGGCSNREFKAVAATSSGGVFLGGAITDFAAGSPDAYMAFLLVRSASGDWAEIVLPDPGALDRVNHILVAGDGSIYLVCGVEGNSILRSPAGGGPLEREAILPAARIGALAEAPDGSLWAAGSVRGAGEDQRPALWKRRP